ncbi:hypothetical protein [Limnoglobus roseus]|uniref:SMI1/KNR4 family protein n=1 Tax=Limnoglobus roseus TaxID=2598579 RepID=A0A5C1ACE9_9BACT|nr:hypothetical protein [Limnoglobus roseus]QEL16285.1 SMI1/KNR4 family protein [Limnoglobus roseus]
MTEDSWLTSPDANALISFARSRKTAWRRGAWGRKMRQVWCHFYRQLWDRLPDDSFRTALTAAEQHMDKVISRDEFRYACTDALQTLHWLKSPLSNPFVGFLTQVEGSKCNDLVTRHHPPELREAVRDIFGNPFRPVAFASTWRTSTAVGVAQTMYDARDFGAMPILADALQDAGCENANVLDHCRDEKQTHVRGCWVVDLVLDKS